LKHRSVEVACYIPQNFHRDAIGPLCEPILKRGKPKAVIKQLSKQFGIMALRTVSKDDGYIARALWYGYVWQLEEIAHDSEATVIWLP
jgi:hypothetical protein